MHYIVDGYNLIFRLLYSPLPLQAQREKVIRDISEKSKLLNLKLTIVFDSSFQSGDSTRSHLNDIEIIYTAENESADDFIIGLLKDKTRQQTVVTSDQKLAWRARRQNAHTEDVERFVGWLNKRAKNKKHFLKENEIPFTPPIKIDKKPSPVPPPKIVPGKTAQQSYEYYLKVFEENSKNVVFEKPPILKRKKDEDSFDSKPFERKADGKIETEEERWLRLFDDDTK